MRGYRVWHGLYNEYWNVISINFFKGYIEIEKDGQSEEVSIEFATLEQYSGVNYNKNTKIYEGDILFDPHYEEYGYVLFEDGVYSYESDGSTHWLADIIHNLEFSDMNINEHRSVVEHILDKREKELIK